MDFDPSWTYETVCPHCSEDIFMYSCDPCYYSGSTPDHTPASFPNQTCSNCGKSQEEAEAEEKEHDREMALIQAEEERVQAEKDRVQAAHDYRKRVEQGIHQNAILHTYQSCRMANMDECLRAMRNPQNEADALRMRAGEWERLRPHVVAELEKRNLDANKIITTQWCQRQLNFFERAWLEQEKEGLECGATKDLTGNRYVVLDTNYTTIKIRCKVRELREGHAESSGVFPCCPAVSVTSDILGEQPLEVIWDPDPDDGTDPREIYRLDKDRTLSFAEYILWSARIGAADVFNPKYCVEDDAHSTEPVAYLPCEWVGKPQMWLKEANSGFRRFQFWMNEESTDWNGRLLSSKELRSLSEQNMLLCCVCYGLPEGGVQDLIECECRARLFCSNEHKEKYMQVHKFHPKLKHPSASLT
ncbi:MAG: hypothetical protein SGILL_005194, partial [Bacillariaceae sp.]